MKEGVLVEYMLKFMNNKLNMKYTLKHMEKYIKRGSAQSIFNNFIWNIPFAYHTLYFK